MIAIATLGLFVTGHAGSTPVTEATAENDFDAELIAQADEFIDTYGEAVTFHPAGGDVDAVPVGSADSLAIATLGIFRSYEPHEIDEREITAIVERNGRRQVESGHGHTYDTAITVKNNADSGISSSELDRGGNSVTLPLIIGKTAVRRTIGTIIAQDPGMIKIGIN